MDGPAAPTPAPPAAASAPSGAAPGRAASAIPPVPATPMFLLPGLPHVTGPYVVGTTDIEWAEPELAPLTVDGKAVPSSGVLVRLFYPADQRRAVHPARYEAAVMRGYRRTRWLPDTRYVLGYGDFLKLSRAAAYSVMLPMLGGVDMPDAFSEAPFLTTAVEGSDSRRRLPVMVFSHGLGGMRTTYSFICAELASYGWVVAAVEHQDRSACVTLRDGGARTVEFYRSPETSDLRLRAAQVQRRIDETFACVEMLRRLNDGTPVVRVRPSAAGATTSKGPAPLDLAAFRDRLDLSRMAVAGHSFGAATAVGASADARSAFRCVLALDAWLFPVSHLFDGEPSRTCPVLFINSETFHWKENLDAIHRWVDAGPTASPAGRPHGLVVTLLQTAHQNQSDFPLLLPNMLRFAGMAGALHPSTAIHLNNRAMLAFLHWHLPESMPPPTDDTPDPRPVRDPAHAWYHADPVLDAASPDRPPQMQVTYVAGTGVPTSAPPPRP